MERAKRIIWVAIATLAVACMDLDLLDDLNPPDSGADPAAQGGDADADGDSDSDSDSDADADSDADGPPATDADDDQPPLISAPGCSPGERPDGDVCVSEGALAVALRFETDEPAVLEVDAGEAAAAVISDDWSEQHHVVVLAATPGEEIEISITAADINDNPAGTTVTATTAGGIPVALTEVLADPQGPEPDQEFVELVNLGDQQLDIGGWMIDDNGDADGDEIPAGVALPPGGVALLVDPDYDSQCPDDPQPDPAAQIIRLDSSIGSNGLKNSEAESVELYDADGLLVSAYPGGGGSPSEGVSRQRVTAEAPDSDPLAWHEDPETGSTPGEAPTI
ncbi:MAG: lamin tail domain-containing protein [Polyangia bacterium]